MELEVRMAKKAPDSPLPTPLYAVPPNHKEVLGGADLACFHLTVNVLGDAARAVELVTTGGGKQTALCPECAELMERPAGQARAG